MELQVKHTTHLQDDFIQDVLRLDSSVYEEEMQGSFESVSNRFHKNKDSYLLIYDDLKLVGYLCFFPISKELKRKMYEGNEMQDDNIIPEDILPYQQGVEHDLFIISVVIDQAYRNGMAVKLLTTEFVDFIEEKNKTNYMIGKVLGTAISEDGAKFLSRLNCHYVKTYEDGSKLFEGEQIEIKTKEPGTQLQKRYTRTS